MAKVILSYSKRRQNKDSAKLFSQFAGTAWKLDPRDCREFGGQKPDSTARAPDLGPFRTERYVGPGSDQVPFGGLGAGFGAGFGAQSSDPVSATLPSLHKINMRVFILY